MDTQVCKTSTSLKCQLNIIKAKNLELVPYGDLFVRYYLSTGTDERVRLNTCEIPSTDEPYWNESITLECHSTADTIEQLQQQSVVFELRWRSAAPIVRRIVGSKLLGRAEIAWRDVLGTAEMSIEKWAMVTTASRSILGLKQPALQVGLKVGISGILDRVNKRVARSMKWDECGCRHGACNGRDEDIFAIAAAVAVL
ncbi:uncharacterized protein LOC131226101 [Magnolia sinica]|uniref:uncharacterized protein LOC131226101 n=1 Tax=Magnolia sinica TaxID=86752 RepID=UPI002657BFA9|nr:uncharacterized protein LOC131226101 [Magnolia sinica]